MPHVVVLTAYAGWASPTEYGRLAMRAYDAPKNPLTVWERFWLMKLTLQTEGMAENVSIIVAPRHDLDWKSVATFYPPGRILGLTAKDEFEAAKADLWRQRGERIHVFTEIGPNSVLSTTQIRERIQAGEDWRNFLSEGVHEYFLEISGPSRVFGI